MRLIPITVATVAAGVAVGILVVANPASARGPYTVRSGTTSSGTTTYTASAGTVQFKSSGGQNLACSASTASGTFALGSGQSGTEIGKITDSSTTGCAGPGGIPLGGARSGTWLFNATGVPNHGVTDGRITRIKQHISDNSGQCDFDIAGSADATFNANTQELVLTTPRTKMTKLTVSNVSGCFGLISDGDTVTFTTTYVVVAKDGNVKITSP